MTEPGAFDQPRASLDEVLCTEELRRRPARPPDYAAENRAMAALAEVMARAPSTILQELVDTARDLCRADSAGISILETDGDREIFRWRAVSGQFGVNAGQGMSRDASPCGTVLDRDAVLLFARPERHFAYSVAVDPPLAETLLVPFHAGGKPVGTVWVINHAEEHRFDAEDARLLESLSRFAAAAYQMIAALDAVEAGRAELERRVSERTRELSDALATLGQIAGGVAHELRNPLNVVRASFYYLNNAPDAPPEKRAGHVQRVERNLARAEEVIATLTNYARFREPTEAPFPAESCAREAVDDSAVPGGVEVAYDFPAGLPPAWADRAQVRIVLGNLVRNAVDAMPAGGRLTIAGRRAGDALEVDVADTGVGIAPADLPRVAEPLFSTKARGMGLGLALSRLILDRNRGGLRVASEPGEGSTFTVRLPVAPSEGGPQP